MINFKEQLFKSLIILSILLFISLIIGFVYFVYTINNARIKVVENNKSINVCEKSVEVYADENILLETNYEKLITKDKIIIFLRSVKNDREEN